MRIHFYYHDIYKRHEPGREHPERPERLDGIINALADSGLDKKLEWVSPRAIDRAHLLLAHDQAHVDNLISLSGMSAFIDADTRTSPQTIDAALHAAGAVTQAIDCVLDEGSTAFCAIRPPGHHAERDRAMGFCFFNNVAIAAAYAVFEKGLKKVLVIDPDVHHGNGTQNIFYNRRDVYYVSIHQFPFYPGTGAILENGAGEGRGFNANFPLPAGMGDGEYIYLGEKILADILLAYRPELILFSAGYDAHAFDPLGGMEISSEGFLRLYAPVLRKAQKHRIPCVFALEGGYSLKAMGESVSLLLHALIDDNLPKPIAPTPEPLVAQIVKRVRANICC